MRTSAAHRFPSPLRYPGGKRQVTNFIKLLMIRNNLVGSEYVEPYAGGASVALSLLFEEYADHVHINDLDRSIYCFWKTALEQPEEICRRITDVKVTTEEWQRQRAIQDDPDASEGDVGFSTFFLNRTSRSGIIRGGIIGGLDQTGAWKIDARFNRTELTRRIERIARHAARITVTNIDAAEYVTEHLPLIDQPFLYLDPPYYVKGQGLYQNFYRHDDHAQVAELVKHLDIPWLVSYDSAPEIIEMYSGFDHLAYDLSYSAAKRYRGAESMFFGSRVERPQDLSPANVPGSAVDAARLEAA